MKIRSVILCVLVAVFALAGLRVTSAGSPSPFDLRPGGPDGPIIQGQPPRDAPYALGCLPSSPLEYPPSLPPGPRLRAEELPSSVDLTGYLPPVGNQGGQGSCVAWATGYYYKSFHEGLEHEWDLNNPDHQFSPSFLYNQRLNSKCQLDWGWCLGAAMRMLQNLGDVSIAEFPYDDSDACRQPTQDQLNAAQSYRAGSFGAFFINDRDDVGQYTNDLTPLKQELANGNVLVFAIPTYDEFFDLTSGSCVMDVPSEWSSPWGGHAIAIIGYDDGKAQFKLRNSWGTDWGCDGDAYLSYEFVQHYVHEAWWMQDRSPADFNVYLPLVQKSPSTPPPGLYGRITLNGASRQNAYVELWKKVTQDLWQNVGTTHTDANGEYRFSGLATLKSGQEYRVVFLNERRAPGQLWRFTCKGVTAYTAGTNKKACDFDVADVPLVSPPDPSSVDLPTTFQWTRRAGYTSDSYEFNLYDKWGWNWWWTEPALGYVDRYVLNTLPPRFELNSPYYWDLWFYTPVGTAWILGANRVSFTRAGPTGPIKNGYFEEGPVYWDEFSSNSWDLILYSPWLPPHSGSWVAWLGGDDNETSIISQQVTVPVSQPYLGYWHWIYSEDVCGYDYGKVTVGGTTVHQYDLCESKNTYGWQKKVVNLSSYAGQTVTLGLRADTDDSAYSTLFIDDVAFQSTATGSLETHTPMPSRPGPVGPKPEKLKRPPSN